MTDRKKPGVAFWATVVVLVVLVVYPLSFGPACWLNLRTSRGGRAIGASYRPIGWLYLHGGDVIRRAIGAWANVGSDDDQRFYGLADDGPIWLGDLTSGTFLFDVYPPYLRPEPE